MNTAGGAVLNRTAISICVMLATVMQALDTTIANVALPYMQGTMAASQDQINWVLTSYIVAAAITTPPIGWLAGRFGRTRLLLISVAGFVIASILCGLAQTLPEMVAFRLMQGVFGSSLVPLSQSILLDINPREKQGSAMALFGVGVMIGPILGPVIGGWLTEHYDWRWVFFINLPIGALAFAGIVTFLPETGRRPDIGRFDWFGFAMLSLGVGSLQLMLDRGEQLDWFGSTEIIAETCAAVLGLYLFVVHLLTARRKPFISLRLFADRNFTVGIFCIFTSAGVMFATMSVMTPYVQGLMDYPVSLAGAIMAPRGIGTMLTMMLAGRLIGRIDARLLLFSGMVLTGLALHGMMGFTGDISAMTVMTNGFIQGAGLGLTFVPLTTMAFSTISPELRTEATGVFALLRNIGAAMSISIAGSFLQSSIQVNHAGISGFITPFNRLFQSGMAERLWNPLTRSGQAMLDAEVTRQASTIAYVNDFKLLLLMVLASMPLVLLLRRPQMNNGPKTTVHLD